MVKAIVLIAAICLFVLGSILAWFGVRGALSCIGIGLALWEAATIHISVDS